MCGRYTLTSSLAALQALFGFKEQPNLRPRTNIAPTQDVVALLPENHPSGPSPAGQAAVPLRLEYLRWGLVPSWAKDPAVGARMINARSETAAEKPAFREAFARRRCLIPADGFYEWTTLAGAKQPYRVVAAEGGPFAFAGLWASWRDRESGAVVKSCTILTTTAAPAIAHLHHRMPVIFTERAQFAAWTAPQAGRAALQELLRAWPGVEAYPVSKAVNKVANDGPALLRPVALAEPAAEEETAQGSLF